MEYPDKLLRTTPGTVNNYEVLAELTEMWWQADLRCRELSANLPDNVANGTFSNAGRVISNLASTLGRRNTWEDAIAIFAGWSQIEVRAHLAAFVQEKESSLVG
jgi:hypothetical protein